MPAREEWQEARRRAGARRGRPGPAAPGLARPGTAEALSRCPAVSQALGLCALYALRGVTAIRMKGKLSGGAKARVSASRGRRRTSLSENPRHSGLRCPATRVTPRAPEPALPSLRSCPVPTREAGAWKGPCPRGAAWAPRVLALTSLWGLRGARPPAHVGRLRPMGLHRDQHFLSETRSTSKCFYFPITAYIQ